MIEGIAVGRIEGIAVGMIEGIALGVIEGKAVGPRLVYWDLCWYILYVRSYLGSFLPQKVSWLERRSA